MGKEGRVQYKIRYKIYNSIRTIYNIIYNTIRQTPARMSKLKLEHIIKTYTPQPSTPIKHAGSDCWRLIEYK